MEGDRTDGINEAAAVVGVNLRGVNLRGQRGAANGAVVALAHRLANLERVGVRVVHHRRLRDIRAIGHGVIGIGVVGSNNMRTMMIHGGTHPRGDNPRGGMMMMMIRGASHNRRGDNPHGVRPMHGWGVPPMCGRVDGQWDGRPCLQL